MRDNHLLEAAVKLAEAMNKVADHHLPEKLAGMVKLHSGLAVGSVLIPVPGADVAAAAANIWTMYARINGELNLPFSENIIKSVAAGVATNIGGAAAGLLVLGTAAKLFPGIGSVGGAALMAATVYGITIVSGIVYMRAVAALLRRKAASQVTETDLKAATEEIMRDKDKIKEMIKEERAGYRPTV
jgi:uncharacterized protein (DUF697 family)